MPISLRGRYLVVAWIAVFLVVAGIITLRDRAAFAARQRLGAIAESLQVVSRQYSELSAEIETTLSPGRLTLLGERLGLRTPTDTEIEQVPVP